MTGLKFFKGSLPIAAWEAKKASTTPTPCSPAKPRQPACSAPTWVACPSAIWHSKIGRQSALPTVQAKPGMPASLRALPGDGAALLVEIRAETPAALALKIDAVATPLAALELAAPLRFTTDAAESAALWNVRKGMFPAIGAMRPTGTTVIIEDVAFPVERLAEAAHWFEHTREAWQSRFARLERFLASVVSSQPNETKG